ncbi:hypothetical protein [Pontibacter korlensis]|nr:hypothetical protein [Pontibacter korlensis]
MESYANEGARFLQVPVFTCKYDYSIGPEHYKTFRFPKVPYRVMETGHCL